HDDSAQAIMWFLTDFVRSKGQIRRPMSEQQVALLTSAAPNIRATITAMAQNFEADRSHDQAIQDLAQGFRTLVPSTGLNIDPRIASTAIPLLAAGTTRNLNSVAATAAQIAGIRPQRPTPSPEFAYSMAGPLAVQATSPGGYAAARLEIANPTS